MPIKEEPKLLEKPCRTCGSPIFYDADVLHHTLGDPTKEVKEHEKARYEKLCVELGLKWIRLTIIS